MSKCKTKILVETDLFFAFAVQTSPNSQVKSFKINVQLQLLSTSLLRPCFTISTVGALFSNPTACCGGDR